MAENEHGASCEGCRKSRETFARWGFIWLIFYDVTSLAGYVALVLGGKPEERHLLWMAIVLSFFTLLWISGVVTPSKRAEK